MSVNTDTLETLVRETNEELASTSKALTVAQAQVSELQTKVETLRAERDAFLSALRRRSPNRPTPIAQPDPVPVASVSAEVAFWRKMNRVAAVERALAAIEPASPQEVQKYLSDAGRDDGRDLVSAALAHLKRAGRVERLGQAQWRTVRDDSQTTWPLEGQDNYVRVGVSTS
jgi:hypothetical protein